MTKFQLRGRDAGRMIALLLLCVLPVIAWLGVLDDFSSRYINASLAGAGGIYGTARGINALVSLLQGTELDVVFLTATIGEVLDPINDLIERFSTVVLVALGSLALQKILLGLVSHGLFNTALTVLAVIVACTALRENNKLTGYFMRAFMVTAFLRFSLGLVVLANGWVDWAFLDENDQERHVAMEYFQEELREASTIAGANGPSEAQARQTRARMEILQGKLAATRQSAEQHRLELAQAEAHLAALISVDRIACTALTISRHTCSANVLEASEKVDRIEQLHDALVAKTNTLQSELDELKASRDCMLRRSRGESCGLMDQFAQAFSPAQFQQKVVALEDSMEDFVENAVDLLMSLLLKSVVIPLLFFYLLLKLLRMNWFRLQ